MDEGAAVNTNELAYALGISTKRLNGLRRQYRMDHGEEAEAKLERWLKAVYEQNRDRVRLLGKSGGYTENFAGALHIRGPEGEQEPESVPSDYQDVLSERANATFQVVKGEELARREARSRAERLRQAELQLRQQGKPHEHHVQAIEAALAAMQRDTRAA